MIRGRKREIGGFPLGGLLQWLKYFVKRDPSLVTDYKPLGWARSDRKANMKPIPHGIAE